MTETPTPDPQAILESLELEMALKRQRRAAKRGSRTAVRVGSIMVVLLILGLALLLLSHLASVARAKREAVPHPAIIVPASFVPFGFR